MKALKGLFARKGEKGTGAETTFIKVGPESGAQDQPEGHRPPDPPDFPKYTPPGTRRSPPSCTLSRACSMRSAGFPRLLTTPPPPPPPPPPPRHPRPG